MFDLIGHDRGRGLGQDPGLGLGRGPGAALCRRAAVAPRRARAAARRRGSSRQPSGTPVTKTAVAQVSATLSLSHLRVEDRIFISKAYTVPPFGSQLDPPKSRGNSGNISRPNPGARSATSSD